jgi:shikimate kinase
MNLALIGLRCAGKTALGRLVAAHLHHDFIDLDERTLAQFAQPTVSTVWREVGEPAWREAEARELAEALKREDAVIALGGGAPTLPGAHAQLLAKRQAGALRIVYVRCDAAVLERRRAALPNDAGRPTWPDERIDVEIDRTLREREPIYAALADFVLDVSATSPRESAEQLLKWLNSIEA